MIPFRTSDSSAVVHARGWLNTIARRHAATTADGKVQADTQIAWMCGWGFLAKDPALYPNVTHPVANDIRAQCVQLAKHIARQTHFTRVKISRQIKDALDYYGVDVPELLPAVSPAAVPVAAVEGVSQTFDARDVAVPANYLTISWSINGVEVPGQDGVALTIIPKADLTSVTCTLIGVGDIETVDIGWVVTTTPAPLFVDQSALNGVRVQVNVADEVTKQDISGLGKATLVAILNGDITLAAALAG